MVFLFAALIIAPIVCKEGILIFTLTDLSEEWEGPLMIGFLFFFAQHIVGRDAYGQSVSAGLG